MEVQRSGEWVPARVSRAPTDERPNDGSFRVKFDSDAYEMKCWYRDLRKPKDAEKIEMPAWVEDFTSLHASICKLDAVRTGGPKSLHQSQTTLAMSPRARSELRLRSSCESSTFKCFHMIPRSDPELNFVIKGPFPKVGRGAEPRFSLQEYTEEEMFWRKGPPQRLGLYMTPNHGGLPACYEERTLEPEWAEGCL